MTASALLFSFSLLAAFTGYLRLSPRTLGTAFPRGGAALRQASVVVGAELTRHTGDPRKIKFTIDGKPVSAGSVRVTRERIEARVSLADGRHVVALTVPSRWAFGPTRTRSWSFGVDTKRPAIVSTAANPAERGRGWLRVAFDERVDAAVTVDGRPLAMQAEDGAAKTFSSGAFLVAGKHVIAVSAKDLAGNILTRRWVAWIDLAAPSAAIDTPKVLKSLVEHFHVRVSDDVPEKVTLAALIDGGKVKVRPAQTGRRARVFEVAAGGLAEGRHRIVVEARDAGAHAARSEAQVVVDTTEIFGERTMVEGAVGEDVRELQRALRRKKAFSGKPSGRFDGETAGALVAFKQSQHLRPTPIVDKPTLRKLLRRIVVDLSACTLTLYDGDKRVKRYPCAVGVPEWPTPTGNYEIVEKQEHPTWMPPPSPWAAGAEPIPPGPGNPLGTRWMGTSASGVGIHGTPSDWTIGTAASHGCIRMYIHDAEELYGLISIGSPVDIVP